MPKHIPKPFTIIFGKAVRQAARLRGGSGSALPGLFVEKIDPDFVPRTLKKLPQGVVVISGTNGKTTTTKMVVSLLESQGLKVFTNRTGSNFVRGVAAALLGEISVTGKLNADIAVLELDEAHAVKFVNVVKPRFSLLLNVLRDQLDRFGEIDTTRTMLKVIAENTTQTVVLNGTDTRVSSIADTLKKEQTVEYFGLDSSLLGYFPSDDSHHTKNTPTTLPQLPKAPLVTLKSFSQSSATYDVQETQHTTELQLKGAYNIFNSAAALSLVLTITPNAKVEKLMKALAEITPAFGRGETFMVDDQPVELVLIKNPAGFKLGLSSYSPAGYATLIAINDNYADGRDMSWLWDVDFTSLKDHPVYTTGIRADDMALRLHYDDVALRSSDTDIQKSVTMLLQRHANEPKRIYCTYTAMLAIRKHLAKYTKVEDIT
ncbi:DUF1727 domain-containing protein [Candidatus Saccharibacteria bacterium TM7i]|nr:DUF1727 domain-containing protein [Candidatus Saccharibacteria bacterium TM7i]